MKPVGPEVAYVIEPLSDTVIAYVNAELEKPWTTAEHVAGRAVAVGVAEHIRRSIVIEYKNIGWEVKLIDAGADRDGSWAKLLFIPTR